MTNTIRDARRLARMALVALTATLGAGAMGGCKSLLEADAPSKILESSLQQPANADIIVAGAVADFECAFASYVAVMGTVADEFSDSQANAATWDLDRRTNTPQSTLYSTLQCQDGFGRVYTPVSIARYSGDNAIRLLDGWTAAQVPNRDELLAKAALYSGYSHLLLGEGFCSAAIDGGPELTPAQIFALAEARFTRVISSAAASATIKNAALVGRARARVDQNKLAEAAADAALVPEGFVFNASYSAASTRSENRVWRANQSAVTVDPSFRNLTFAGVPDPRVVVTDAKRFGGNGRTPLWVQGKYAGLDSPIPIATWEEAMLIRAEAAGGQTAVGIINQLHAKVGLPPFASSSDEEIKAQIIEERRRELWLESQRLYDTIRFNIPLNPAPGAVFVNGGGTYGDQKCLPLPDVERLNNPNLH